jgi:hypothetical protein
MNNNKFIGDMQVKIRLNTESDNSRGRFGIVQSKGDKEVSMEDLDKIQALTDQYVKAVADVIKGDSKAEQNSEVKEDKLPLVHSTCAVAKGIKFMKCGVCGKEETTYANGINICKECATKNKVCIVCGKPL